MAAVVTNNAKQATATATTMAAMTDLQDPDPLAIEIERLRGIVSSMSENNLEESLAKADIQKSIGVKVYEREMVLERQRMKVVAQQEEELHLHDLLECPICLEHIPIGPISHFLCCGKHICNQCYETNKIKQCPLCRSTFPREDKLFHATQKHAENGAIWAMHSIATMYDFGKDGQVVEKQKALQWYRRAADQGYALSMYRLGCLYFQGIGGILPQSFSDTHRWVKAAADNGFAGAQTFLGEMKWNGEGLDEDREEGVRLFTLSLSQDPDFKQESSIFSSLYLGIAFYFGVGIQKSLERAKFYLSKAAHANESFLSRERLSKAQYNLGCVLLDLQNKTYGCTLKLAGYNCMPRVLYWFRKSLNSGHPGAANVINHIISTQSICCAACDKKQVEILPDMTLKQLKQCIRCNAAWYCCKECQVKDWKGGHKTDCIKV